MHSEIQTIDYRPEPPDPQGPHRSAIGGGWAFDVGYRVLSRPLAAVNSPEALRFSDSVGQYDSHPPRPIGALNA